MRLLKLIFAALMLLAPPAFAQAFKPGVNVSDTNPSPVKLMCWDGTVFIRCTLSGGGGGGGDASAANQTSQIALETEIRDRLGSLTSPAAGSTNAKLEQIRVALGSPLQAGASVGISGTLPAYAATPTFNLGTIGTAATAANQTSAQTVMQGVQDRIGALTTPAAGSTNKLLTDLLAAAVDTSAVVTKPQPSATTARSSVTAAAASTLLLATNSLRTGCSVVNDSAAILYIGLSTAVSATSYEYVIDAKTTVGGSFECPFGWTGPVYGIWASATGAARVGERTQ